MSIPTAYTTLQLSEYIHGHLGATAAWLSWSVAGGAYVEIVIDALLLYGVDDIAEATNIERLRAAARLALWERVAAEVAHYIAFTEDGQSFSRQQMYENVRHQLLQARRDAGALGVARALPSVSIIPLHYSDDPYMDADDEDDAEFG